MFGEYSINRFSSDSILQWSLPIYSESPFDAEVAFGNFVDSYGNSYVAYTPDWYNIYIHKYHQDGSFDSVLIPIENCFYSYPISISGLANEGRIYLMGYYYDSSDYLEKMFIAVYDTALNFISMKVEVLEDNIADIGFIATAGNYVYHAYTYRGLDGNLYLRLVRYSSNLLLISSKEILLEGYGELEFIRGFYASQGGLAIWTYPEIIKTNLEGYVEFTTKTFSNLCEINGIAIDNEGFVYSKEKCEGEVVKLRKYGMDGKQQWELTQEYSSLLSSIYVSTEGYIYTVGVLLNYNEPKYFYLTRYLIGEVVNKKYAINISTGDNQIVAISSYSTPMVSLVKDDTNKPVENIGLTFNISTYPAGATGFSLTKSGETTNSQGLADVQLKLGNIPAEYSVTATCPNCEPSASSVTFTCCGKLPNDHFSQSHVPAWSYNCYANHNCAQEPSATIGYLGCGVTSLATLINYYSTHVSSAIPKTDPGKLNNYLQRLPDYQGYDRNNDIRFDIVNKYSNNLIRYISIESKNINEDTTQQNLLEKANKELLMGRPVIFRVFRGSNKFHFVMVIGKCGSNYIIVDPIGGVERLYNPNENGYWFNGIRIFRPY